MCRTKSVPLTGAFGFAESKVWKASDELRASAAELNPARFGPDGNSGQSEAGPHYGRVVSWVVQRDTSPVHEETVALPPTESESVMV